MSRKYYKMNSAELLVWLNHFCTVATDNKVILGFSDNQLDDLKNAKNDLEAKLNDRLAKQEAAEASTAALKTALKAAQEMVGFHNNLVKSNAGIEASLIELLGLDAADDNLTPVVPVAPADLVVEGRSNGINYLKWSAGGNRSRINFILEAKIGSAPGYVFVTVTTKTRYQHREQPPASAHCTASGRSTAVWRASIPTKPWFITMDRGEPES